MFQAQQSELKPSAYEACRSTKARQLTTFFWAILTAWQKPAWLKTTPEPPQLLPGDQPGTFQAAQQPTNSELKPTYQQIPQIQQIETSGQTLPEILNFILREIMPLDPDQKEQKLAHYLRAFAWEAAVAQENLPPNLRQSLIEVGYRLELKQSREQSQKQPSSQSNPGHFPPPLNLELIDPLYEGRVQDEELAQNEKNTQRTNAALSTHIPAGARAACQASLDSVRRTCQKLHSNFLKRVLNFAKIEELQRKERRFELELAQVERLSQDLLAKLQVFAQHAGLSGPTLVQFMQQIAQESGRHLQTQILDPAFKKMGWKKLDREASAALITPEIRQKLKLPLPTAKLGPSYVGPKQLYLMPQAPDVHPGGFSMYVIVQPAYLPELNQWVLLQSQQMIKLTWDEHLQILATLGVKLASGPNLEQEIMQLLITLPDSTQTQPAAQVFVQLLHNQAFMQRLEQLQTKLNSLGYDHYAQYLLQILTAEGWPNHLSPQQIKKILAALEKIVIHGLVLLEPLTAQMQKKLFQQYLAINNCEQNSATKPNADLSRNLPAQLAKGAASVGFSAGVASLPPGLSAIECLAGLANPASLVGQPTSQLASSSGFPPSSLFGAKQENCLTCPQCGQQNPLSHANQCVHCGFKRGDQINPNWQQEQEVLSSLSSQKETMIFDQQQDQARYNRGNSPASSIGLGTFVANLIG